MLGFANSSTCMLEFAELRWVDGRPRVGMLGGWLAKNGKVNSSTQMLKLRVAGGWPRPERLSFANSGTHMLEFTEPSGL